MLPNSKTTDPIVTIIKSLYSVEAVDNHSNYLVRLCLLAVIVDEMVDVSTETAM